jgi:hypothetical protein
MSIAVLMQQLRDAGAPMEAIMIAVAAVEAVEAKHAAAEEARKANQRERTAKHRAMKRDCNVTITTQQRDPSPKDNNQTPTQPIPPSDPIGSEAPKGARRPKSILCPDDFQPNESHFAKAAGQGRDRAFVIATRDRMHRWSHANAGRPVARKSDWNLAFHSFLDRALAEAPVNPPPKPGARASPTAGRSSPGSRLLDRMEARRAEHSDQDQQQRDFGPVLDHEADGGPDRQIYEQAGGQARRFPAQAAFRIVGSRW